MFSWLMAVATENAWTMDYAGIVSGLQTGLQTIGTAVGDMIETAAPVGAAVAGGYVVIRVGMKTFRRIIG